MALGLEGARGRVRWYYATTAVFLVLIIVYLKSSLFPTLLVRWQHEAGLDRQATAQTVDAPRPAEDPIRVLQKEQSVQVVILLDQSGSMKTTDPGNLRIEGIRYLVESLAGKGSAEIPHEVAVIEFGSKPQPPAGGNLIPLPSLTIPAPLAALAPRNLGDTNILGAIQDATRLLHRSPEGGHKRRIVLLTDGTPDDSRKLSQDAYFAEIDTAVKKAMTETGARMYVEGLDARNSFTPSRERWARIVGEKNVQVLQSPAAIKPEFNRVVRDMLDLPAQQKAFPLSPTEREVTCEVTPFHASVEFHIFPANDPWDIVVLRPDGTVHAKESSSAGSRGYRIVRIRNPQAGRWKVALNGSAGRLDVYIEEIPKRLGLLQPTTQEEFPQGKPMRPVLSLEQASGGQISPDPANPLAVTATVRAPDKKETRLKFTGPDSLGLLTAESPAPTPLSGHYQLEVTVQWGTRWFYTQTYDVPVASKPYLQVEQPQVDEPVPTLSNCLVRCRLMREGRATDAVKEFQDHPDRLVFVQFPKGPHNKESATWPIPLAKGTPGTFEASLPFDVSAPAEYLVALRMRGMPKDTRKREATAETEAVKFRSELPAEWMKQADSAYRKRAVCAIIAAVAVFLVGNLLLAGVFVLMMPRFSTPRMKGRLRIDEKTHNLDGRRGYLIQTGKGRLWVNHEHKEKGAQVISLTTLRWLLVVLVRVNDIKQAAADARPRAIDGWNIRYT